jgi:SAM-dependent methyltransferase
VHLLDIVPLHVEQALEASRRSTGGRLAGAQVGDARRLPPAAAGADAVLLLGPLYHLTRRADRLAALSEARRVLRAGGVVLAAVISRLASLLDGLSRGMLDDAGFAAIVRRDLIDGQHRNPTDNPAWFTTAFFHRPGELGSEITEAGLCHEASLAIEGPGWLLRDFDDHWGDAERRQRLLDAIRSIESEPTLMGSSAHILAVGRKP